jgi:hypothetical protein
MAPPPCQRKSETPLLSFHVRHPDYAAADAFRKPSALEAASGGSVAAELGLALADGHLRQCLSDADNSYNGKHDTLEAHQHALEASDSESYTFCLHSRSGRLAYLPKIQLDILPLKRECRMPCPVASPNRLSTRNEGSKGSEIERPMR